MSEKNIKKITLISSISGTILLIIGILLAIIPSLVTPNYKIYKNNQEFSYRKLEDLNDSTLVYIQNIDTGYFEYKDEIIKVDLNKIRNNNSNYLLESNNNEALGIYFALKYELPTNYEYTDYGSILINDSYQIQTLESTLYSLETYKINDIDYLEIKEKEGIEIRENNETKRISFSSIDLRIVYLRG